jgi:hypothetical protein
VDTETNCEKKCNDNSLCKGFSWPKNKSIYIPSECWLKQNIDNKDTIQQDWVTYTKN